MDHPPQEPKMIEVTIEWVGGPCSYKISTGATIKELKRKIKGEFIIGWPIRKQDLEYNGEWLQNDRKLEDYGIHSDVVINLVRKIDLWIFKHKYETTAHLVLVNETITVAKLKEFIAGHFGVPNITRLSDNLTGVLLEDDMTLNGYGFGENSEVKYYVD